MHTRTCIGTHSPSLQICNAVRTYCVQADFCCLFVCVCDFPNLNCKIKGTQWITSCCCSATYKLVNFCLMVCLFVFVLQLGNFFSLTEKEVPGYEAPSLITELHIHLEDLVMDYRCV